MLEYNGPEGLLLRSIDAVLDGPDWVFEDDDDWIDDLTKAVPDHVYVASKARNTWGPPVGTISLTFVFLSATGYEVAGGTATLQAFTVEPASVLTGMASDARGVVRESDTTLVAGDLSKIVTCKYVAGLPNGLRIHTVVPPVGARKLLVFLREHRS